MNCGGALVIQITHIFLRQLQWVAWKELILYAGKAVQQKKKQNKQEVKICIMHM